MTGRSGSSKRKRTQMLTARFNEQEAAAIREMADSTGCSVGALIRHALLNVPPPRAIRRPSVDHKAVARLLGQLGAVGNNINQLAYHANVGRYRDPAIEGAMRDLSEMRLACLQALGFEPVRRDDTEEDYFADDDPTNDRAA